jgi:hypothetical protein
MGRKRSSSRKLSWTRKTPSEQGWYWYRHDDEVHQDGAVLYIFDPLGDGHFKAWDWDRERLSLCLIAGYEGEWWGPITVPK